MKLLKQLEVPVQPDKPTTERIRPKVIEWKGVKMVRNHSFLASVQEIIDFSSELDVVKVGIIGNEHSGKTTLAQAIAHTVHKNAKIPYAVRIFYKEHLVKFEETLKTLQPTNYILIFDDVSFLEAKVSKHDIDVIKQAVTEIRHLPGGQDVKIILIMNYHSVKALSPYLRQADFRYCTTVMSDTERDNMLAIMGTKYYSKIEEFQVRRTRGVAKKYFTYRIGSKELFPYKFRNPFIPVLFWNNERLRDVVSPTRQWIDPICSVCANAENQTLESEISLDKFFEESENKFQKKTWLSAVRLVLLGHGLNVFSPNIKQAIVYLDRALAKKTISLEDMAKKYNLEVKQARLRKKLDGVLADEPIQAVQS